MKHAFVFGLLLCASAFGQGVRLTWDGYIDGSATLYIQGRNVDAQGRTTGAVDRPRFRFDEPLPASPVTVEVRVRQGRGNVRVVEQPSRQNDYSAVVQIDNRDRGADNYSLDFYWTDDRRDGRGVTPDRRGRGRGRGTSAYADDNSATWSGQVDDEALILFRGRESFATAVRGPRVQGQRSNFSSPLPRRAVNVRLEDARGRGQVELLEQPGASNGYSAKVRILDDQSGSGDYAFTLTWSDDDQLSDARRSPRGSRNADGILTPNGASSSVGSNNTGTGERLIRWFGRVDNRVEVVIEGDRVYAQRVEGQRLTGERVEMSSPLPRDARNVEVRKIQGRGEVAILEQPDRNGRLVFEVRDGDGGADDYQIEIRWQ